MASGIPMDQPCPCGSGDMYRDCCGRAIVVRSRQRRNAAIVVVAILAAIYPVYRYMNRLDAEKRDALTLPEGSYYSEEHKHWHGPDDEELKIPGYVWDVTRLKWLKVTESLIEQAREQKARDEALVGAPPGEPIEEQFTELPEAQSGVAAPEGEAPAGQEWSERHGHYHETDEK